MKRNEKKDKWRGHVVTCAFLASTCAGFSFTAFRLNSWGKWRKSSAVSNCLPLPPPIGCAELFNSQDVLTDQDTDFGWLCLANCFVSIAAALLTMNLLSEEDNKLMGMEKKAVKKLLLLTFVTSAILSTLTCLIATFRMNILSTLQRRQGMFVVGGLNPAYAISFYLTCLSALLALFGSYIANLVVQADAKEDEKLTKTIKQHMSRNLMYPDDQRSTKMVTFSSMPPAMEEAAAEMCVKAVMKFDLEEDIAENVKQNFEHRYGPTWHCAAGVNFGSAIHHKKNDYIEVATPATSVLLFRCSEPPMPEDKTSSENQTDNPTE